MDRYDPQNPQYGDQYDPQYEEQYASQYEAQYDQQYDAQYDQQYAQLMLLFWVIITKKQKTEPLILILRLQ